MGEATIEQLYRALTTFLRLRAHLGSQTRAGLSLVAYTLLADIASTPETRATDLAARFGLDKSTLSRQIDQLERQGFIGRQGEQPGRRGQTLAVTPTGRRQLEKAAQQARRQLGERLTAWDEREVATLTALVERLNQTLIPTD